MLFYSALFVCFFTILAFDNKEIKKAEPEKTETIFADVIKNISRVNNVLQDLIHNYEQLQKMYISKENFDVPEYVNEEDSDDSSRNKKKSKRASLTTSKPHMIYQAGTRMIVSDTEIEKTTKVRTDTPVIKKTTVFDPVDLSDSSDIDDTIETEVKRLKQLESSRTVKTAVTTTTAKNILQSRKPVQLKDSKEDKTTEAKDTTAFVDTHKKVRNKIESKPKIMPEQTVENNSKKLKTKYNMKDTLDEDVHNSNIRPQDGHDRNISNLKVDRLHAYSIGSPGKQVNLKIKVSENPEDSKDVEFTGIVEKQKNTEKEINQQKYSVLKVTTTEDPNDSDNQRNYATSRKAGNVNTNTKTKTANKIDVSQIDSATLRSQVDNKSYIPTDKKKNKEDISSDISDDDKALTKDMFKTSVLRQAYGDACLKLVVRKCHRACKNTLKSSCRVFKCRSEVKSCFKKRYTTACERVFEGTPGVDLRKLNSDGPHVDITREGYLSVACQPQIGTGMSAHRRNIPNKGTIIANSSIGNDIELNILRDRYEKACQRLSQGKCTTACNYAHNATCVKFQCEKKLKKSFRRNCKNQCKRAYTSTSKKQKSSGSDSDSDGSGSDDDSSESDDD